MNSSLRYVHDVVIYKNGWISPRTRRGREIVDTGVKCGDQLDAIEWCLSKELIVFCVKEMYEDEIRDQ